jgi:hypothetical protein
MTYYNKFPLLFAGGSAGGVTPLFDLYSDSILGISISRKLRTAYTGDHLFLRRADGATTATQYVNNEFDEAGINTWIGAQSAFIHTVYDNSLSGNNAVQTSQSNQPRIALNGVIEKSNGEPAMFFDGVNDVLDCGQINGGLKPDDYSTFLVHEADYSSSTRAWYGSTSSNGSTANTWAHFSQRSSTTFRSEMGNGSGGNDVNITTSLIVNGVQGILQSTYTDGDTEPVFYFDDNALPSITTGSTSSIGGSSESNFTIGRKGEFNGHYTKGLYNELTVFNVDNVSNRVGIRDNINSNYNSFT